MPRGQPRKFKTKEEFKEKFLEYLEYCESKEWLPNIAGFCVYMDMTRETFYAQKNYYSDMYKKIQNYLENGIINNKHISNTEKIFYLKCKFNYIDKQVVESTHNINTGHIKEIYKALEDED